MKLHKFIGHFYFGKKLYKWLDIRFSCGWEKVSGFGKLDNRQSLGPEWSQVIENDIHR